MLFFDDPAQAETDKEVQEATRRYQADEEDDESEAPPSI